MFFRSEIQHSFSRRQSAKQRSESDSLVGARKGAALIHAVRVWPGGVVGAGLPELGVEAGGHQERAVPHLCDLALCTPTHDIKEVETYIMTVT